MQRFLQLILNQILNGETMTKEIKMTQLHLWVPQDLKDMLTDMHQEWMEQQNIKVNFSAFIQHLIEEAVRIEENAK